MTESAQAQPAVSARDRVVSGLRAMLEEMDELATRTDAGVGRIETAAIHVQLAIDLLNEARSA